MRRGRPADTGQRRIHERYRLLAAASIDGRIDPEEAAELEGHLLTCDLCSADFAAMQADNRLLASPSRVPAPHPRVRAAVIDAARGSRVPRIGSAPRPWAALVATGLVVAVIGGGVLLSLQSPGGAGDGPSGSPTPVAPALWSVAPSTPYGRAEARLAGNSQGAAAQIDVRVVVIGGVTGIPEGYVEVSETGGAAWRGSINQAVYLYDLGGQWYVAKVEGCKGGGQPPCERYALQLVDGRARDDGQDEVSLTYAYDGRSLHEIEWPEWYLLTSGFVEVGGPMGSCCAPATSATPLPLPTLLDTSAIANGIFIPDNEETIGRLAVAIEFENLLQQGGSGSIQVTGPTADDTWTGVVVDIFYWHGIAGNDYVAYAHGCKSGTPPNCEAFAIQLIDNRANFGPDRISLSFFPSIDAVDPNIWQYWFRVEDGYVEVAGPMPELP